jgi:hypothetical protein
LNIKPILWCNKENAEMMFENTKNLFNDILCRSMAKIKQLFFITWPIIMSAIRLYLERHKSSPGMCMTPFSKMISYVAIRYQEFWTVWITCISKVVLARRNI